MFDVAFLNLQLVFSSWGKDHWKSTKRETEVAASFESFIINSQRRVASDCQYEELMPRQTSLVVLQFWFIGLLIFADISPSPVHIWDPRPSCPDLETK